MPSLFDTFFPAIVDWELVAGEYNVCLVIYDVIAVTHPGESLSKTLAAHRHYLLSQRHANGDISVWYRYLPYIAEDSLKRPCVHCPTTINTLMSVL